MKRIAFTILGVALPLAAGCGDGGASDQLMPDGHGTPYSSDSLAAGRANTFDHPAQPMAGLNGVTDLAVLQADDSQIGTPDVVARLHGAQKIPVSTLGTMLADLGVDMGAQDPASAAQLYASGQQALGAAVFASRVPEMVLPSTSSLAKQYDVFLAAAPEILANLSKSTRCPGVALVQNGQLTADGISCLIGKPATPQHVTLANQLVTQAPDANAGQRLAIATLLEAAHTSE
jgi:hypothetical protein